MVFTDKKSQDRHHNRMNLRDTSSDPTNLHGDANIPRASDANLRRGAGSNVNDDNDLNDRVEDDGTTGLPSDLPDLETAHVPHAERRQRSKNRRKPAN